MLLVIIYKGSGGQLNMMILVRALIANDNKEHEIYKMTGKIFSMGTPVEKIADYVESLITKKLNSLEIKIIKSTDGLIGELPIETSREPKKSIAGNILKVKWEDNP
jgi:hypothetical protein